MATIGKIRKHSGLLIGIIGVALALFVLQDFMSGRGGRSAGPLAEVFGEDISFQDFSARVEQRKMMYAMQYGKNQFTSMENFQLNNEVYDLMVREIILQKEYDAIGMAVSDAEFSELISGRFVDPMIRQLFTDPNTGVFDVRQVQQYIANLDNMQPEAKSQWKVIEQMVYENRFASKYVNLINKGFYFPKAFVNRDNVDKGKVFVTSYTGLKFSSIADASVSVTEEEMRQYYEEHKYDYVYDEAFATIDYLVFHVKPSAKDMDEGRIQTDSVFSQLSRIDAKQVPAFVVSNSDIDFVWDSTYLRREVLPVQADSIFKAPVGALVQPYLENNEYQMHRLLDRKTIPDSLKAAHILIAYQGAERADKSVTRTKEQAKHIADSLLTVVKGKDSTFFAEVAKKNSNDGSVTQNAGFMGWFAEGMMVPEFNKFCLEEPNGTYGVVETIFGFHVIKTIDKTKPVEKIKLATIKRTIEPSKATSDSVYNLANVFAAESPDAASYYNNLVDKGYVKRMAEGVKTTDFSLPGIDEGREIIRWAFNEDTEKGTVSQVFTLDGETKYVIAVLDKKTPKGQAEFEDVKKLVEPWAKKEKKAKMLMDKMNSSLGGVSTVEALAKKLNTEVDTFDVSFATRSLPGYGPEPAVVGYITTSGKGGISKPVKGEMGIFVYSVQEIIEPKPADAKATVNEKMQFFQYKINGELFKALQRKAEIEDNRLYFF